MAEQEELPGALPEAGAQPEEAETAAVEVKPEKTLTQAEVDEVVRKVKDREYRKRAKLARELDTLRSIQPPREPEAKQDGKEPQRKDFEDYEEYVAAKAAHAADQAASKRLRESEEGRQQQQWAQEQEALEESWDKRRQEGAEKYPDFEESIKESEVSISFAMGRAIKESDIGHEILYHLSKHPDEAEEIASLSVAAQIRAIGRLEGKISSAPVKSPPRPAAPPSPVSARGAQGIELSRNLSNEEWNKRWDLLQAEKARIRAGR